MHAELLLLLRKHQTKYTIARPSFIINYIFAHKRMHCLKFFAIFTNCSLKTLNLHKILNIREYVHIYVHKE